MMANRKRRAYSFKKELIKKSQESALAAIQIFNSPLITFKSESFIVLINIAWTYLLHAYYRGEGVEYRQYKQKGARKVYMKTRYGEYRYWGLESCLNDKSCPLSEPVKANIKFLIKIRHEIEHRMSYIDDFIEAYFQACCINYNDALKKLFGGKTGLDKTFSIALQLFSFGERQIKQIKDIPGLPKNIIAFVSDFENDLVVKDNSQYCYRVKYNRDSVDNKNQADNVISLVDENSEEGKNGQEVIIKRQEKQKYLPSAIVNKMKNAGFPNFSMHNHITLWKKQNAKKQNGKHGVLIEKTWYWYENWLDFVAEHCRNNYQKYR